MKKKILFILSMMLLMGCQSSQQPINKITLTQPATLLYFYIETCSECQSFQDDAIPYLQETFGDTLTIQQYDLDDEATQAVYEDVITQLDQFDQSLYGMGPMYALDGYFAKVGYTSGDEEYLVKDIDNAINDKALSDDLSTRIIEKVISCFIAFFEWLSKSTTILFICLLCENMSTLSFVYSSCHS